MTSPGIAQLDLYTRFFRLTCKFLVVEPLPTGPGSEGATWVNPPMGSLPAEEAVGVLVQCALAGSHV